MKKRTGFTLIELTITISIMVLLTAITLSLVNVSQDSDRVRSGASEIQSFIEGARNRAMSAKEHFGVRILYESDTLPSGQKIVYGTTMLYVKTTNFTDSDVTEDTDKHGMITVGLFRDMSGSGQPNPTLIDGRRVLFPYQETYDKWNNLVDRGLISKNPTIYISGRFYTLVITGSVGNYVYRLTRDFSGKLDVPVQYTMTLNPIVTPYQEPITFPRNVVVDLANSQVSAGWTDGQDFDIMFNPDGTLSERTLVGFVNLVVAEAPDVYLGREPGDATKEGEERIVSVHAKTGSVIISHVDITDFNGNGKADDPFNYALLGERSR